MGTGVMDVDEDRDRGGDDYGDEDGGSWRELGCWIGEILLRFGVLGSGNPCGIGVLGWGGWIGVLLGFEMLD